MNVVAAIENPNMTASLGYVSEESYGASSSSALGRTTLTASKVISTPNGDLRPEVVISGPSASVDELYDSLRAALVAWGKTRTA